MVMAPKTAFMAGLPVLMVKLGGSLDGYPK